MQILTVKLVPVVLVGKYYWHQAFLGDFLVSEGVITLKILNSSVSPKRLNA
jgi:hypothetical protein